MASPWLVCALFFVALVALYIQPPPSRIDD